MLQKYGTTDANLKQLGDLLQALEEEAIKVGGQARKRHLFNRVNKSSDVAGRAPSASVSRLSVPR